MKSMLPVVVGSAWLLVAVPAAPHHAFSSEFDINRPLELTGAVTRVEWTNPHAWLYIETEDDSGNVQNWAIELVGINFLFRRGFTRDKVQVGDVINVRGYGARNGSNNANAALVALANTGEVLWVSARAEDD